MITPAGLCSCGNCGYCGGDGRLLVTTSSYTSLVNGDDGCMSCPHCEAGRLDREKRVAGKPVIVSSTQGPLKVRP